MASRPPAVRPSAALTAVLALVGIFAIGARLGQALSPADAGHGHAAPVSASRSGLGPATPTWISIPAIDVRAKVVPVGLATDGSIATPPDRSGAEAGWYADSPTPGEDGPAVIVGHVDTATAPAVFYRLSSLRSGELITVFREDNRAAVFRIDSVATFPKTHFPADRIFDGFARPRLRLVTCGGKWVGGRIGYADNVVVFATYVGARQVR